MQLSTNKIGIVGMGQTGCSVLRWLLAQGQQPVLFDSRDQLPQAASELLALAPQSLTVYLGEFDSEALNSCDVLVVSPGISIATPAIAKAAEAGTQLIGDVELFCLFDERPRIAITGSNGKSTVTTLVADMLHAAGIKAAAIGNIGVPVLDEFGSDADVVVMELSSFQLETTYSLQATVACNLNVSADHLDRYDSFEHYAAAKARIYQQAKVAIWNRHDQRTKPHQFSGKSISFGLDLPEDQIAEEQWGVGLEGRHSSLLKGSTAVFNCADMAMLGGHNQLNALAALACVAELVDDLAPCANVLRTFTGLPHRCEPVYQQHGVTWVNDSKATNEGATLAALDGLNGSYRGKLILLAGGDGKGTDFCTLKQALNQQVDELICFGKDAVKLASKRHQARLVSDLEEAVRLAHDISCSGDLVLLSPACASLDQFPNYMVRGQRFAQLAKELAQEVSS
ncbi:UDP-N-acetylmuramoyl-L-alanine--D-glutamate ligase [Neiella marina]|uniref:UDP-N-acetylmuramoylalanine--D-glutamate ligase n=1 Tax=Neiella holothuriorum TaxID=2870530 RepID=A0ABS7EC33_9GAMM|nr:UDP-N-acetylmuramoyl-L-alanine--D-glutamate ligase [Neiella holothuriorum]MBW8189533.1 UDP-N-acetylmuramoyl-L-alanine--D-glutamate ligase [Neiella holothuriorum]